MAPLVTQAANITLQRTRTRVLAAELGSLGAMKISAMVVALLIFVVPVLASGGRCAGKVRLTFSVLAKETSFHSSVGPGLEAYVVRDGRGWEVQVFAVSDRKHRDNLLYPPRWHGAYPCQIQPGVGPEVFPDTRTIPIRTTTRSLCIRLIGVKTNGDDVAPLFTTGRVELSIDGA